MRKLIIHLGPPKTATTALQYFLAEHSVPGVKYLGVNQPRSNSNSLIKDINQYTVTGNLELSKRIQVTLDKVFKINEYVLVSEEMLLVHSPKSSIKEKLTRLYNLTTQYDTTFLLTLRNPELALPSYYQEIYKKIPENLQKNFNEFCFSEYAKAYDYLWLDTILKDLGVKKIKYILFDNLISGRLQLTALTNDLKHDLKLQIRKENEGRKKAGNIRLVKHKSILEKIILSVEKIVPTRIKGRGYRKIFLKQIRHLTPSRKMILITPENFITNYYRFIRTKNIS